MTTIDWDQLRLSPMDGATPSWVQVLSSPRGIRLMPYDAHRFTIHALGPRWSADIDTVPADERLPSRGDLLCYVGKAGGVRGDAIWPPVRVIDRRRLADGNWQVTTLGDGALLAIPLRDIDEPLRRRLRTGRGDLSFGMRRRVLQLWSLDVDCPECGWLGTPLAYGLPPEPPDSRDWHDDPNAPGRAAVDRGCVFEGDALPRYACPRCQTEWPAPDRIIENVSHLLNTLEVPTMEEAEKRLGSNFAEDVQIGATDAGVELRMGATGYELTYPFYAFEVWEALDDLENELDDGA